jgi:hypothetical protein
VFVGVSNSALKSKFLCACSKLQTVLLGGHKVYTSLSRTSLDTVFDDSRYQNLCYSMLVVGLTSRLQAGERGKKSSRVSYTWVDLKTARLESYAKPWFRPLGL